MSRSLANWLDSYLEFTEEQESPESFHFWTGLVVIASALRRRVWLDRGWEDYLLYPNIYVLLVAESATTRKSQAIDMGLSILKEAVPDIYTLSDSATPEGIVKHINRATHTVSGNGKVTVSTESGLLIHADELASLFGFDRQRASRMGMLLTRVYRSPKQYQHTIASEAQQTIYNPYFTLIAATAPQNMKVIPPESTGGLMGRLIIVAERQRKSTIAWGPKIRQTKRQPEELHSLRQKLVADLFRISELQGELKPTPDAIEYFEVWYRKQADIKYTDPNIDAFHARCHDTALQLASLVSVAESDEMVLHERHIIAGIKFVEKQLPEFTRLMEWAGASEFGQNRAKLMDLLRRSGGFSPRRALLRGMELSTTDFDSLVASMIESGLVEERKLGGKGDRVYRLLDEPFRP